MHILDEMPSVDLPVHPQALVSGRQQIMSGRFEAWYKRLTAASVSIVEVSGGDSEPTRAAADEQLTCSSSSAGAAGTIDGLHLVEEVADWLRLLKRTQCQPASTDALKISAADGLCGAGSAAEVLHRKAHEVDIL